MSYISLFSREKAARERAHRRREESNNTSEVLRLASRADNERESVRQAGPAHFEQSRKYFEEARHLEFERDELGQHLEDEIGRGATIDEPGILTKIVHFSSLVVVGATVAIDFIMLAATAVFLLSLAGISNAVLVWIAKLVVPLCIVAVEMYVALRRQHDPGDHGYRFTYGLPTVISVIAGATYLAWSGVTELGDIDLLTGMLCIAVMIMALAIHLAAMSTAPHAVQAWRHLAMWRTRRTYKVKSREVEVAYNNCFAEFVLGMRAYDRARHEFGLDVAPEFHLIPLDMRDFINDRMGWEIIPTRGVGGDGAPVVN